jgi:HD superfamily phosphohydrolase
VNTKNKQIRAVYDEKVVRIYQAYNSKIANEALRKGTFGTFFDRSRMTWIKPSFLWMMYRSGWASKKNQERILAIDIDRNAFKYLVENAIDSKYHEKFGSYANWKRLIKESDIRAQWDPERDVYGKRLNERAIQIGLRGNMINKYVDEWIVNIVDITELVLELKYKIDNNQDISNYLPKERLFY